MQRGLISPRRTVVDGVPTYWADVQVPFVAMLSFRVGRADETLVTGGLTHLVEHIAIPIDEPHGLEVNGSVGPTTTLVWASGPPDSALEFIESVAASLSAPPLERFETERRILQTEAAGGGPGAIGLALMLRFGARGYGLIGHEEYGLNHLNADHVAAWAKERFTRENAVLWLTDKPPRGLRLPLPSGRRIPAPDPAPIPEVEFPCVYDRADTIALTCLAPRSTALAAGASIAHRRLRRRLRFEGGLSYSVDWLYEPLTGNMTHLAFTADLLSAHAEPVRDGVVETLSELARVGPTRDELDREAEQARRDLSDRHNTGSLHFMATNELLDAPMLDPSDVIREHESLEPSDVAAALTQALESALLLVPVDTGGDVPGFARYPVSSSKTVTGKRYFSGRIRRREKDPHLVAGSEGVRLVVGEESAVVLFEECEALVRRADGTRMLWSTDGFFIYIDPTTWRGADGLAELVDERVPESRWVPMDPEHDERLETVARASSEGKMKRGWMTNAELALLPELLKHDEEVLLASRADRVFKAGVLAVTNRRLLFLYLDELALEIPLGAIEEVSTKRWGLLGGRKVIVRTADATYSFGEIKKELLERFAELLRPAMRAPAARGAAAE